MRGLFVSLADRCERVTAFLLTVLMGVMVLIGFYQVLARFVLHDSSPWSEEVLRRAMIWMVALGLSIGFRHGSHICVDVINRVQSAAFRSGIRGLVFAVTLAFLLVLMVLGIDMAWRVRFQSFASIEIAMTWAYAAIPVGAILSAISLTAQFLTPPDSVPVNDEFGGLACQE
ncbi:MAG: TRAP transporter small permease [Comamonadaceae bacterium]|nr:MAG: TRAP transporter small permease [Comamonadaceae bacterium]